jgi:hypothetical protein
LVNAGHKIWLQGDADPGIDVITACAPILPGL